MRRGPAARGFSSSSRDRSSSTHLRPSLEHHLAHRVGHAPVAHRALAWHGLDRDDIVEKDADRAGPPRVGVEAVEALDEPVFARDVLVANVRDALTVPAVERAEDAHDAADAHRSTVSRHPGADIGGP